jgi:tRNA threonylcarbamoyladenosine biosynthesis protein TsaB
MNILGFDTSSKHLSIAIAEDDKILSSVHEDVGVRHSALLLPKIKELLQELSLKINDIDVIAISIGPGSFTGLRIGVATLKALAFASNIKVVAIPTMDAIAYNHIDRCDKLALCLDARKNMIYSCFYDVKEKELFPKTDNLLETIDELVVRIGDEKVVVFGDGLKLYGQILKEQCPNVELINDDSWYPQAETVVHLGFKKALNKEFVDAQKLVPLYLHPSDCHIRSKNGN